jgi:NAD(P)-dependent dehydrogenase (short-subunit alcohol dehydrogenase family)
MDKRVDCGIKPRKGGIKDERKNLLVSGANSGLGKATALGLTEIGTTVVIVSRNRGRGEFDAH